jgi:ribosomal protein S18 acetylase RimI-like enzyme
VIVSPDGQQVAASLVWIDPVNESAEIDPLGTHPDYRRRGLARAILRESFRRMQARGLRYAYIAANAANPVSNQLYASLQPVETYDGHSWVKHLD